MPSAIRNPMGTPTECAAAEALITPALVAQADEIRQNNWDWHPHALLPADLSLVAYCDGIWIVETGCLLNEVVRYARVADFGPVRRVFIGIEILSNDRGEIPVTDAGRDQALRLMSTPGGVTLAEVPAPEGGWNHASLEAALDAHGDLIALAPAVTVLLGPTSLGKTRPLWAMRR